MFSHVLSVFLLQMFGKQEDQTKAVRTDQKKKNIPMWKPEYKGEEPPF